MIRAAHARYVLDASVAAKWFTRHHEADRSNAIALRRLHESGRTALTLFEFSLLEIVNAVRYSEGANEPDAIQALELLEQFRLDIVALDGGVLRKATSIAWAYRVALYDAAYVALAERLGFPLVTADEVLMTKMKGHGSVVRLRDLEFS